MAFCTNPNPGCVHTAVSLAMCRLIQGINLISARGQVWPKASRYCDLQELSVALSQPRHRQRVRCRRCSLRVVQAEWNLGGVEVRVGIGIRRTLGEPVLHFVQLALLSLGIARISRRGRLDCRGSARHWTSELAESGKDVVERGNPYIEYGGELTDEFSVDSSLDVTGNALDGRTPVVAASAELGEREGTGECAWTTCVCAEEHRLAYLAAAPT